ncbi:hypothetical protein HG530_012652 [Fusarium avenaceum]|nr:hypothetical protein HG530_012652 [Fusarium avenaceum]
MSSWLYFGISAKYFPNQSNYPSFDVDIARVCVPAFLVIHNPTSSSIPSTKHNHFQCVKTTRHHSLSTGIVLFAKALTFHERHTRASRQTAPRNIASETVDPHESQLSNSQRPDNQARPSDIFDNELSLQTPQHITSQQKQVKCLMNDIVDSPTPSKIDPIAVIKANLRLLPDSERAQLLGTLNIEIPKFNTVERAVSTQNNKCKRSVNNTNRSIQYLDLT